MIKNKRLDRFNSKKKGKTFVNCHFTNSPKFEHKDCTFIDCTTDGSVSFLNETIKFTNETVVGKYFKEVNILAKRGRTHLSPVFIDCFFDNCHFTDGIFIIKDCGFQDCSMSLGVMRWDDPKITRAGRYRGNNPSSRIPSSRVKGPSEQTRFVGFTFAVDEFFDKTATDIRAFFLR